VKTSSYVRAVLGGMDEVETDHAVFGGQDNVETEPLVEALVMVVRALSFVDRALSFFVRALSFFVRELSFKRGLLFKWEPFSAVWHAELCVMCSSHILP